jgi:ribose-phosphate pyrophosphokinase
MITYKAKTSTGEIIKSALSPFTFPAGEAHTKREERRQLEPTEIAIVQPTPDSLHDDLFHLAMWANSMPAQNPRIKRVAIIPYFPGARADRGTPFGAEVYTDFVYSLMLDQVITYDPHSEVYVELLTHDPALKVTPVYPHEILGSSITQITMPNVYDGIIAPDEGAKVRAGAVARELDLPLYTAIKKRDFASGKLGGFGMEQTLPNDGLYLIVDDICDGGGTFVGLANHLQETTENIRLDLYVSHGVFSKSALENLEKAFSKVFTTDSYDPHRSLTTRVSEFQDDSTCFRRIDIIRPLLQKVI